MKIAIKSPALLTLVSLFLTALLRADRSDPMPPTADQATRSNHNVVLFVTDGLRHDSVTIEDAPTIYHLRQEGVDFVNSHSHFPTVTTANASALATGHGLGDTGNFTNNLYDDPEHENDSHDGKSCNKGSRPVTFGMENNFELAQVNCLRGGNYLGIAETLISLARKQGYSTAVVGKLGPTAIQDIAEVELVQSNGESVLSLRRPDTVIIDGGTGQPDGFPIPKWVRKRMIAQHLDVVAPDRSKPGTPNVAQQQYFTDVVVRAILPQFKEDQEKQQDGPEKTKKPFLLVFWSADPDSTQHSQGDSPGKLEPGINGPSSKAAIHNADRNLSEILEALDSYGLLCDTDVIVTADHGFSTVSRGFLDAGGFSKSHSYAAETVAEPEAAKGLLPAGFLAIDLAHALQKDDQLYDVNSDTVPAVRTASSYTRADAKSGRKPDPTFLAQTSSSGQSVNPEGARQTPLSPPPPTFPTYKRVVPAGDTTSVGYPSGAALIGGTGIATHSGYTDAEIIVQPSGDSELIYLPHVPSDQNNQKDESIVRLVAQICDFLTQQDYVDGVFVRDDLGEYPGTLSLSDIGLYGGSAKLTVPAIVVNLKGFALDPKRPWYTWVQIAVGHQQGQGEHGGLNRADTFNNVVAMGPDFRRRFTAPWPVSNADLAQTIGDILGLHLDTQEMDPAAKPAAFAGRVLYEALEKRDDDTLRDGPDLKSSRRAGHFFDLGWEVKYSRSTDKGFRTVLHLQRLIDEGHDKQHAYIYLDQACLVAVGNGPPRCRYSTRLGPQNRGRLCEPRLGPNVCAVWTQMVGSSLRLRAVISEGGCPEVFQDEERRQMELRAAADENFPEVCQFTVKDKTRKLTLYGKLLPLLPDTVERIAILGDSGCRIKKDEKKGTTTAQVCDDPVEWPFRDLADLASYQQHRPQLVVHLGDYYYRESACPEDKLGCKDSPFGDKWESWDKDFFEPAQKLLEAAPWVFVRGNHENCERGGRGWSKLFAPEESARKCRAVSEPNKIHLDGLNLYVLDSAEADDDHAPSRRVDPIANQLRQIERELARQPGWILVHHPLWGIRARDSAIVNLTEQAAMRQVHGREPLPGLELVLSGHIHEFSTVNFVTPSEDRARRQENRSRQRAAQWIVGTSGDKLELDPPFRESLRKMVDGVWADTFLMEAFGFVMLDRDAKNPNFWKGRLLDARNRELARCELRPRRISCDQVGSASLSPIPSHAPRLRKVVAGGQTGVDQAGLRAARKLGLETGGWCPPDCKSLDGPIPVEFGLKPTPEEKSSKARDIARSLRTEWNVRESDATLILRGAVGECTTDPDLTLFKGDPGTAFTILCAQTYTPRPLLVCDPDKSQTVQHIVQWLRSQSIETLNVAGPAESTSPGIGAQAEKVFLEVFDSLHSKQGGATNKANPQ